MQQYDHSFRKLVVWQSAKKLVALVYELTKKFPHEEIFGMTSQLRRAAVSVCANLAEGNERTSNKEKIRFFVIAKSSLVEVDCLAELSLDRKYLNEKDYFQLLEFINKTAYLICKLIKSISQKSQYS
ncbi:MAG: four helix bundle protein [Patescibacteria group bacterium]